jgi:hypothetical protein
MIENRENQMKRLAHRACYMSLYLYRVEKNSNEFLKIFKHIMADKRYDYHST